MERQKDAFLEFEERLYSDLRKFRFIEADLMMWPYIRDLVSGAILNRKETLEGHFDSIINIKDKRVNILQYGFRVIEGTIKKKKHHTYMFLADDRSNMKTNKGDYVNQLYDPYAELLEDVAFFERSTNYKISKPRRYKNVICTDYLLIKVFMKAKFSRVSPITNEQISNCMSFLRENLTSEQWDALRAPLEYKLVSLAKRLDTQQKEYAKLFRKIQPKYLIINGGCYSRGHILKTAHAMGIHTIELQHGIIYSTHYVYNFSNAALNDVELADMMPKTFFTFGVYWNEKCRIPCQCISVGKPPIKTTVKKEKNSILFITGREYKDQIHDEIEKFLTLDCSKGYKCYFRPHPADADLFDEEKRFAEEHDMIYNSPFETIDDVLARVEILVGAASTVDYEALKWGVQPFVVYNEYSDYCELPDEGVVKLEKDMSFADYITHKSICNKTVDISRYYALNWEENVKKYMSN